MGWNMIFVAINIYWIKRLMFERRPVTINDDERRLYKLAFRKMKERHALKLFRLGVWTSYPTGKF